MEAQRLAKDNISTRKEGGALSGKVGFKLEDGGE